MWWMLNLSSAKWTHGIEFCAITKLQENIRKQVARARAQNANLVSTVCAVATAKRRLCVWRRASAMKLVCWFGVQQSEPQRMKNCTIFWDWFSNGFLKFQQNHDAERRLRWIFNRLEIIEDPWLDSSIERICFVDEMIPLCVCLANILFLFIHFYYYLCAVCVAPMAKRFFPQELALKRSHRRFGRWINHRYNAHQLFSSVLAPKLRPDVHWMLHNIRSLSPAGNYLAPRSRTQWR